MEGQGHTLGDYVVELVQEEDGTFLAEVVDLPGCMAAGDDPNDAMARLQGAFAAWTKAVVDDGGEVPAPQHEDAYSGRLLVRMMPWLHARLARAAAREGVSMNQLVVTYLSERVGAANAVVEVDKAIQAYVRVMVATVSRSMTSEYATDQEPEFSHRPKTTQVVYAGAGPRRRYGSRGAEIPSSYAAGRC